MTNSMTQLTRRTALKAGALAIAAPYLSKLEALAAAPKVAGLQLYTLRDLMAKDPDGTLAKVAQIGYKKVENFGYADGKFFGKTPKDYAALLKSNGLAAPSGHYLVGQAMPTMKGTLTNDWSRAVDDAAALGQQYMVCAFLFPDERKTIDDYKRHAELFNKSAEACKAREIQFAYHNHDFEFKPVDGQVPYDILLKNTDPNLVKMELDLYWTVFAGKDPVELFNQNAGRFPLWHLKDMAKTEKREFAEVGTGSIDFAKILKEKKTAGLVHSFVEQDVCQRPPLEAIAISYQNVQKLNI